MANQLVRITFRHNETEADQFTRVVCLYKDNIQQLLTDAKNKLHIDVEEEVVFSLENGDFQLGSEDELVAAIFLNEALLLKRKSVDDTLPGNPMSLPVTPPLVHAMPPNKSPNPPSSMPRENQDPELESYRRFLECNPKSNKYMDKLSSEENVNVSISGRRHIVNVSVSKLIQDKGYYPSTSTKMKVAKILSNILKLPQEVFFDGKSHRGYITSRIDYCRSLCPTSDRKWQWPMEKKGRKKQPEPVTPTATNPDERIVTEGCYRDVTDCLFCGGADHSDIQKDIDMMMTLSSSRRGELGLIAERTFCYRQFLVMTEKWSVKLHCEKVPKYLTMPDIILNDFSRLYGEEAGRTLLQAFPQLWKELVSYCQNEDAPLALQQMCSLFSKSPTDNPDAVMKALMYLLPTFGKERLTAAEAFKTLFSTAQTSEALTELSKEKSAPHVIRHGTKYFIAVDGVFFEGGANAVEAVDFLFKLVWVFRLEYPQAVAVFFKFLQHAIYKVRFGNERIPLRVTEFKTLFKLA